MRKYAVEVAKVLCLEDYTDYVERTVDPEDFDALCESAWALKALANNPKFLSSAANNAMKSYIDGQSTKRYTANSLTLYQSQGFNIRANFWKPISKEEKKQALEAPMFSYFTCHDHNYHFVTASFCGPGYDSDLFTYTRDGVVGYPGESVDIEFVERFRFGPGDLMVYEGLHDAHIQHPPTDFSVTLNLIARTPTMQGERQLLFDVEQHKVATTVGNVQEQTGRFLELASIIGDGNTVDLLLHLATTHAATSVREAAREQLYKLVPAEKDWVERKLEASLV